MAEAGVSEDRNHILLIEDDDFIREIFRIFLEDFGYQVSEANNGRTGLELFREKRPDLVMLDLRMPEMDGLDVLAEVKRESPDTPTVVVSGMGTIGDVIKALKLGAWDYIAKPVQDMTVLQHSVAKNLERAALIRENKRYREHLEQEVQKRTAEIEERTRELEKAYESVTAEVEERRRVEQVLRWVNREQKMLSACNHAVVRAADELALARELCAILVETGGYAFSWVGFSAGPEKAEALLPVACVSGEDATLTAADIDWQEAAVALALAGRAVETGQRQSRVAADSGRDILPRRAGATKVPYGACLALPLVASGNTLGALLLYTPEREKDPGAESRLLGELADDLAYGIYALRARTERRRIREELQIGVDRLGSALEGTVKVLASTVEVRDPYTAGHQKRVATLAARIGQHMGLEQNRIDGIYMAGLVHDLGKIYIPAEILSKPNTLSDIELSLIRTHPQVGYDLLKTIDFSWPIAQIVLQHHERLNGEGYPNGLKGDEILPEARILTVADVVEAMASHRPYRPARGVERALREIRAKRGSVLDPRAVDACLDLFETNQIDFANL